MQSHGTPFLSTNTGDVLDFKAITEYERDRQRAHKSHDVHNQRKKFTGFNVHYHTAPAWKRVSDEKEKNANVLSRNSRPTRAWREYRERVDYSEDTEDEDTNDFGKENKYSTQNSPVLVRLEDLVVRPTAVKKSRQYSPKLISRPATPRSASKPSFDSVQLEKRFSKLDLTTADTLVDPLMDTFSISINFPSPSSDNTTDYDDDDDVFEFSSPGAEEWTVVVAEDGSVRYSNAETTATTTFAFMPCAW